MKILEIGGYPPPNTGWSVRIKFLKEGFVEQGDDCRVLNLGRNRKLKSSEYIDVQNGADYLAKLIRYRFKGYHFHIHMNGQAVKGPILALLALFVSLLTGECAALTFHGGIEQLYFPKRNAGKMFWIIYLNFLFAKLIICNNRSVKNEIMAYGPSIGEDKVYSIPAFSIQYLSYQDLDLSERIQRYIKTKEHCILCYIAMRNGFFIDTVVELLKRKGSEIGIILSGVNHFEDNEISGYYEEIKRLEQQGNVLTIKNLSHDLFMTLLKNCTIFLRTPVSDGVASSVLESLSQNVPVVASENGRRPEGVITYNSGDVNDLVDKINYVLTNIDKIKEHLTHPEIRDTVSDEVNLLKRVFAYSYV